LHVVLLCVNGLLFEFLPSVHGFVGNPKKQEIPKIHENARNARDHRNRGKQSKVVYSTLGNSMLTLGVK